MGNAQGKESQSGSRGHTRRSSASVPISPTPSALSGPTHVYHGSRSGRGSRHDLSFLALRPNENPERDPALEPRRETKPEREARRLEEKRALRVLQREKSLREEGVDGGFLVTLGVYTGVEDFSKPTVRQLQIERRLAPFWKGLDDYDDTWTEHQLVAVANGRHLPAADQIPSDDLSQFTSLLTPTWISRGSESNLDGITLPMSGRSMSASNEQSATLSPLLPASSLPSPLSPISNMSSSSHRLFRDRAKTLASLASSSRNTLQTDMGLQELQLPKDPSVNGQRVEAFLYKNAFECPICFMFYPPYLNKTRCCDQPICSECFVQIKRSDPHMPEHHGEPGEPAPEPQEDIQLVSEPAACPYCAQPEFGVTYEPPPFRRGLVYHGQGWSSIASAASPMSSTSSLNSSGLASPGRRRATSLAVNDKTVITTDMVRPDWAKKLADAKAHALRKAAAATALHNAAYMIGNLQHQESRFGLGRRRRTMFGVETTISSGNGTPRHGESSSGRGADGQNDLFPGRNSARRGNGNRLEDLEELMMMEAIRLSIAAEEERKRKEEKEAIKEAAKEAKKEGKKKAKENKKAVKAQRNIGSGFHPIDLVGFDEAGSSTAAGKGKAVDRSEESPLPEPSPVPKDDAQKYLADSRAQIQRATSASGNLSSSIISPEQHSHRSLRRSASNASSSASSLVESCSNSLRQEYLGILAHSQTNEHSPYGSGLSLPLSDTPDQVTPTTEPMLNFQSLAKAITASENKPEAQAQHIEDVAAKESEKNETEHLEQLTAGVMTLKPNRLAPTVAVTSGDEDDIGPEPLAHTDSFDQKHIGDISVMRHQHATQ